MSIKHNSRYRLLVSPFLEMDAKQKYGETGNPVYVWETIHYRLMSNKPLPEWVNEYLLETSKRIYAIKNPKKRAGEHLLRALGFRGGKDFSDFNTPDKQLFIYLLVQELRNDGYSVDEACSKVAQENEDLMLGEEGIKAYYYAEKKPYETRKAKLFQAMERCCGFFRK